MDGEKHIVFGGEFVENDKFASLFNVAYFYRVIPDNHDELRDFLAQNIDGIGVTIAQRMIEKFGDGLGAFLNGDIFSIV